MLCKRKIQSIDKKGIMVPQAYDAVYFVLKGEGTLIGMKTVIDKYV